MKSRETTNTASKRLLGWVVLSLVATNSWAFDSGSTGADGAFSPTADTGLAFPANGILNLTTLNIPSGVTVNIGPNAANGPAIILVQGDAVIDGVIDISGASGESVGSTPGGFAGGLALETTGGTGQGPGGSQGGLTLGVNTNNSGGNGGSYGTLGGLGNNNNNARGSVYGSTSMQPLLGGSGGGASGIQLPTLGYSGGDGGGAILIAVTGTLTLNGVIMANGGDGAPSVRVSSGPGGPGSGGGSGGGVRLIASTFLGSGDINVSGGNPGLGWLSAPPQEIRDGGAGGAGRVRIEADAFTFTGTVTPSVAVTAAPSPVFIANLPTIRITAIGGSAVPANPVGESDVILPATISNPVTIEFAATGVPLGSVVDLTLVPTVGNPITVPSSGLAGTVASSSATAQITLPQGPSVLYASISFAATGTTTAMLSPFTSGEQVASVELRSSLGQGRSSMHLTTVSGRIIEVPAQMTNL